MPTKDDFRKVAKTIKRELDQDRLAFKTYQKERLTTELKAIAGDGAHKGGTKVFEDIDASFTQEGLLIYPHPNDAEEDGYIRIYRSGSRMAGILNAIRFPGGGSDEELANLLGKIKPPPVDQN